MSIAVSEKLPKASLRPRLRGSGGRVRRFGRHERGLICQNKIVGKLELVRAGGGLLHPGETRRACSCPSHGETYHELLP